MGYDDNDNELLLVFENQHFTLEQFDTWVAKNIRAWRAALVSYGDVFVETKAKHAGEAPVTPCLTARVIHDVVLSEADIKSPYNSDMRYLYIGNIQKLKQEGVTDLEITYKDYHDEFAPYIARIPITDLTQDSLQVTLALDVQKYTYYPNPKTKWGSFFKKLTLI